MMKVICYYVFSLFICMNYATTNKSSESYGHGAINGKRGSWFQKVSSERDVVENSDNNTTYELFADYWDSYKINLSTKFRLLQEDLSKYNSKLLNTSVANSSEYLCHNEFCCHFDIGIKKLSDPYFNQYYTYHLVVYAGNRKFSNDYERNIEVCAVVACLNSTLSSCGLLFERRYGISWLIRFEKLEIIGNFSNVGKHKIQYPISLLSTFTSIPASNISWTSKPLNGCIERKFSIINDQTDLMTFAIYGQNFLKKTSPNESIFTNGSPIFLFTMCFVAVVLILVAFFSFVISIFIPNCSFLKKLFSFNFR